MGKIIKKLSRAELSNGLGLDFELNESPTSRGDDVVHIQNQRMRCEFTRTDFIELATVFAAAAEQLKRNKSLEDG